MAWGEITEERLAEAAALIGQPLRRSRLQWIETATRDAIRHLAWGVGDDNPLWLDEDYAARSPAGDIVAPPCILYAVDMTIVAPKLSGVQWIYAGTDFTWFDRIRLDTRFEVEARLVRQEIKSGRRFAKWVLQTGEVDYRDSTGRLIAKAVGQVARTPRGEQLKAERGGEAGGARAHRYAPEELDDIEREVPAEAWRGAEGGAPGYDVSAADIMRAFALQNSGTPEERRRLWKRNGRICVEHGGIFPMGFFACRDGHVALLGRSRRDWRRIATAPGDPEWTHRPGFDDPFALARDSADADDNPVPAGTTGQLLLRPRVPNTYMIEYINKPEATLAAWRNLWYHSGDLGYLEEDGYVHFVGREAHRIRRRGENVSAFEVEKAIMAHEAVVDCACVGVPSDLGEEDIKAYVQVSAPAQPRELVEWCRERIAYFKTPRYIEFVEDFPRTMTKNEIARHELRERGIGACWDAESDRTV